MPLLSVGSSSQKSPGQIVTFYSYKGGTGRSMLVANCAWMLAHAGYRVLIVDWDLEAPGVHRYFAPFLTDPQLVDSEGVVDLVVKYAAAAVDPQESGSAKRPPDWFRAHADVLDYSVSINWQFPRGGSLSLMPAGRQGSTYAARMNTFGWNNFYDRLGGYSLIEALKDSMRSQFDFVLIDSRTGVSDTAGICTVQLPDKLVVCFTLNNQSIDGAAAVARSVLKQKEGGGCRVFPVPTRIDNSESSRLNERWRVARKVFDDLSPERVSNHVGDYWDAVAVQYVPIFAYEEVLAAFANRADDPPTVNLTAVTARIVETVFGVKANPDPVDEKLRSNVLDHYAGRAAKQSPAEVQRQVELAAKKSQDDLKAATATITTRARRATWVISSVVAVLIAVVAAGITLYQKSAATTRARQVAGLVAAGDNGATEGQWAAAASSYSKALELDPNNVVALSGRARAYGNLQKWGSALADWNQAVMLQPDQLSSRQQRALAFLKTGAAAAALNDIQYVLQKDPTNLDALQILGETNMALARPAAAAAAYETILKQQPNDAATLVALAGAHQAAGNKDLAISDFERAIDVDPRSHYAVFAKTQLGTLGVKVPDSSENASEVIPVVYIQYANALDAKYAQRILQVLKEQRLEVPAIQLVPSASAQGEVRYFFPQDLVTAGKVRDTVQRTLATQDFLIFLTVRELSAKQWPKAKPGLIEVWLPPLRRNVEPPVDQSPAQTINSDGEKLRQRQVAK